MTAFEFRKSDQNLIVSYTPYNGDEWLWSQYHELEKSRVEIGKSFSFPRDAVLACGNHGSRNDVEGELDFSWEFLLGTLREDGYYHIDKDVLGLKRNCLIYKNVKLSGSFFLSKVGGVPLLQKIDMKIDQQVVIGGMREDAIPEDIYKAMRRAWPSTYWVKFYVESQIERQLSVYVDVKGDAEKRFERYLSKKRDEMRSLSGTNIERMSKYKEFELSKYEYIRDRMTELLSGAASYSEDEWCNLIMEFILLLYPRYIQALYKVTIPIRKDDGAKGYKQLDVLLLDSDGHVDVIEVKRPGENDIFSLGSYRGNKYPGHTLSGTVMQMESYLYHLKKGGYELEDYLNKHCEGRILKSLQIRVVNPKGILILGRSNRFTNAQKLDFEIIRRKYASIIDILTYDDLLARLANVIEGIKKRC